MPTGDANVNDFSSGAILARHSGLLEVILEVVAVAVPTLLFAAFLFGLMDHHHCHQPHTHTEAPIVRNFVTPALPPPPAPPFFQGNSLDAANEIAARLPATRPESYVTAPPLVLTATPPDLSWLPTYPSQSGRG